MNNQPRHTTPSPHSQPTTDETRYHKTMDARARRAAKFVGLRAVKSRSHFVPNEGGFQLVDLYSGRVEAGSQFELSAEDVLDFCQRWPEESKFRLGASQRYDAYLAGAHPLVVAKPAKAVPVKPAKPARREPTEEMRRSQPEDKLEPWGFNGPEDLEIPRPAWVFTFAQVCGEFGFKSDRGVNELAKNADYPPLARRKKLITRVGCDLLKAIQQKDRASKKHSAYERAKKRQNPKAAKDR